MRGREKRVESWARCECHLLAQPAGVEVAHVVAVEANHTFVGVVEARGQPHQRALARARCPDDRDLLAAIDDQIDVLDAVGMVFVVAAFVVAEDDVLEAEAADHVVEAFAALDAHLRFAVEIREDALGGAVQSADRGVEVREVLGRAHDQARIEDERHQGAGG